MAMTIATTMAAMMIPASWPSVRCLELAEPPTGAAEEADGAMEDVEAFD